ncbi:MAG: hypothetical protein K2J76_08975 [Oscillospiraceae bacterium]|nr:hypothetical protein [Oscillospiraceae bacterium]
MAAKKCPLCGGHVKNNYCDSCGYSLPDEEDISALYNYDPSDYPQEEPAIREITPEHITEEIYPNRPEPMEFKVREEEKKDSPFVNPYANQNNGAGGANGASPYANNIPKQSGSPSPYAGPYVNNYPPQNNAPQQNQNPYANNGSFKPYTNPNQNATDGSFGEFWKKHWLFALLTLLVPFFGIIWLCMENKKFHNKYRTYVIILIVIGFITKI